jgi:hypothetical protein
MLKTNSLILDTLFHNIKLDLDVFGCITRFVVVSVKYCRLIVAIQLEWSFYAVYHSQIGYKFL